MAPVKYFDRMNWARSLDICHKILSCLMTIADNIARFGVADPDLVVQAATDAGVHM